VPPGIGLIGCAIGGVEAPQQTHKEEAMPHELEDRELIRCTRDCLDCGDSCTRTAAHCLQLGGPHAAPDHQTVLQDCADICYTSARFMQRGSHLHAHVCRVCAEACVQCAEECERTANGDRMMQECARICRRCAESCQKMAGAHV
jgi:hypothetical protein